MMKPTTLSEQELQSGRWKTVAKDIKKVASEKAAGNDAKIGVPRIGQFPMSPGGDGSRAKKLQQTPDGAGERRLHKRSAGRETAEKHVSLFG